MTPEEMVGARVYATRGSRGMTQDGLGAALGQLLDKPWPRQTVSLVEKGKRGLTSTELLALAEVLETTVGHLLLPPIGAKQIEMPKEGVVRTREQIERLVVDPEVRNVAPTAIETLGEVGALLNEHLASGTKALRKIREGYEVLTVGGKLPDDGLKARAAYTEEIAQRIEEEGTADGKSEDQAD